MELGRHPAGSGVSPQHTYAAGGTYPVDLTVTDNDGATDRSATRCRRGAAERAADGSVHSSANGLTANFNGGGSSDSDGNVVSYSWNWGDGTPARASARSTPTRPRAPTRSP